MKRIKLFEEFLNEGSDYVSKGLTTLKGLEYRSGDFDCRWNNLTSLEGAPQEVSGNFICSHNELTSLEGGPREVSENFSCGSNQLTSLEGAPQKVRGSFWCEDNHLISLKGAPREIGRDFFCTENPKLTSLEGAPKIVKRDFVCNYNPKLTSLKGAPQAKNYMFDRKTIDSREVELYDYDIKLFKKWLASGLEIRDFMHTNVHRGRIASKKFGI
jgi:hypothetical protein